MPRYKRHFLPGGTYFFTIVTYRRRRIFADGRCVDLLRGLMANERAAHPFEMIAAVVLPDHLHCIMTLPPDDADYSGRIGRIKAAFTKHAKAADLVRDDQRGISASRMKHRESDVWHRRFWERTVRDDGECAALVDYIHYNPVKHGVTRCPHEWPWSSFHRYVQRGVLERDWGCACDGRAPRNPVPPGTDRIAPE